MIGDAARHFSRAGMGRGAFEAAFPRYQTAFAEVTFTHPENILLQLWAEFGALGAAALVLLALRSYARLLQRHEASAIDLAVLCGLGAMALHDLFDFSLELPGCAVAACVALGVASRSENGEGIPATRLAPWAVPVGAALGLVSLIAASQGARTLADAEQRL